MKRIYLAHHCEAGRVLCYDPESGRHMSPKALPAGASLERGAFVDVVGKVYGVYASAQGPVFFAERQRIVLRHCRKVVALRQVLIEGKLWRFVLHATGEADVEVRYKPPGVESPWAEPDPATDFFVWLEEGLAHDRFYSWHTLSE